jgi:hypothetical protein
MFAEQEAQEAQKKAAEKDSRTNQVPSISAAHAVAPLHHQHNRAVNSRL